jgi:hypothetical protein
MRQIEAFFVVLCVALFVPACGGGSSSGPAPYDGPLTVPYEGTPVAEPPDSSAVVQLEEHRQLWSRMKPDEYRIYMNRYNSALPGSSGPVGVWVANGVVVRRWFIVGSITVAPENEHWWPDVEGLFDVIEAALARGAPRVDVTWNSTYGIPILIQIDEDAATPGYEDTIEVWDWGDGSNDRGVTAPA